MKECMAAEVKVEVEQDGRRVNAGAYMVTGDRKIGSSRLSVVGEGQEAGEILRLAWRQSTPATVIVYMGPVGERLQYQVLDWRLDPEPDKTGWKVELLCITQSVGF